MVTATNVAHLLLAVVSMEDTVKVEALNASLVEHTDDAVVVSVVRDDAARRHALAVFLDARADAAEHADVTCVHTAGTQLVSCTASMSTCSEHVTYSTR